MSATTRHILGEVAVERMRQNDKFPDQHLLDGTSVVRRYAADEAIRQVGSALVAIQGVLTWRHILHEEFLEAVAEENPTALREELIQVAAVAVRWIEDIDSR